MKIKQKRSLRDDWNQILKHLIPLSAPTRIIELVLHRGYIKNADSLSLIILAKVGARKTELAKEK